MGKRKRVQFVLTFQIPITNSPKKKQKKGGTLQIVIRLQKFLSLTH